MPQTAAEKTSHQPQISACDLQQCDSTVQSAQRMEDIEGEQKTVMVTGDALGPENQELCSLYFENKKRSGGGDIIEDGIKWDEKRQCFFITFVESEVAKNVAPRDHLLQNMVLRVELYSPQPCRMSQPPAEACYKGRVHVSGLPDGTTSDFLQNYLESIADVSVDTINLNEKDNSALVIFESSDEAFGVQTLQKICQENPMADEVNLTFQAVSDHELGAQTSEPRAVMVLGLKSETETKAIQCFFSNKKRNHRGPLENIERDPGSTKAVLHFKNLEDAESVVKKGNHVLDGNELCVKFLDEMASADGQVQKTAAWTSSVKIPKMFSSNTESSAETDFRDNQKRTPPQLQNMSKLGFNSQTNGQMFTPPGSQGMAKATDSSAQIQYTEFKKGKEPSSHYNEQGNQYHQTDSNEFKKGTEPSSHYNQLDYQYHQTNSNLNKMICATVTTAHEVDYHQHNSRFNTPLIPSKTEHLRDENYFENNPEYRHQEDQQTLKPNCPVPDSDELLAQRSGVMQNRSPCNTSQTVRQTVIKLSKAIIQRIISDGALLQALTKNIKSVDGKFQWLQPDCILVKCLVDNPAKDWEQNVAEVISCFVSTHLQDPGERPLQQHRKPPECRGPQPYPEDSQSAASSHPLSLAGIVEQTIPNLKPAQLKILRMSAAVEKLCKDYPGLEITLDEENKTAIVKNPEDFPKKAFIDVLAFVTCFREMKIHLTPPLIKMYEKEDAREWIQKTLIDKKKLVCHWEVCNDGIVLCGQSAQLGHLEKMFKDVFKEVSVKVEKKELCLLKTRVWESFLEVLQEKSREGRPAPLVIPVGNQIQIIDIPSNISNTQLALKEFLENNKLEEVTVPNSRVPDCDERLAQRSSFMQNRSPCNTSQTIRQTVIKLSKAIIQRIISDGALLQAFTRNIKSVDGNLLWQRPDCILVKCLVDNPAKDWEQNVAEVISCFVSTHLQDPGERPLQQHRKPPECRGPQPYPEDSQSAASSHPLSLAGIVEQTIPNLKPAQLKILRMSAAVEKLCKDYPGLEITLDEENKTAIVKNPEDFPKKAFIDVLAFVTCFREMKIHLTPPLIKMYEKEDAREWIQKTLIDKKKLVCHWEVCNDGIVLCGQSAQLRHLEKMFKEVFKEVSVKVEKKELCLLKTRVWESFLEVLQEKSREGHPVPLVIPVGNQIQIIDIPSNISNTQLALKEFLENNKLEEVTVPNSRVPDCDERLAQRSSFMQNRSPCNTSQTIRQTVIKLSKAIIQRIISDGALLQAFTRNIKSVDGKLLWQRPDCILVKCLVDNPAKDWEQNVAEVISCFVSTHLQDPGERPLQQHRKPPECRGPQPYPEDSQSAASSHPLSLAGIVEQTIPNLKPAQLKILRMSAAVEKLCKDYPGLEITLDEENKTAIVKNPEDFPKKAFIDVLAFVTCFREMKIHLTPPLIKMYEKEDARDWIQKTLIDKKKLVCHWEVCNDGIVLCGQSAQLRHLEKMFKDVFKEVSVKVEKKELCLLKTRVWESFLEVLQEKSREGHPAPLVIPVGNQIQIIDIPSNIRNTQLALKEFLENNKLEEVTVPNSRVPDCDERLAQRSSFMQNRSPCNTSQTIRQTVIKLSKAIIQRIISDGALLQAFTRNIKSVDGKLLWQRPDCILVKCLVDNPAKDWEQNVAEVISCFVSTHLQDPGERPLQQHRKPPECRGPQPYPEDSQSAASSHPLSLAGIVEQTIPNLKPAQLKILRMSAAVEKLCKDYPGLEITLDEENKMAIVKNPEDFPKKAFIDVLAFVTCFREMKIHLTPPLIKMYEKEDARDWIQKTLIDKKKLVCHWEVCNDGIVFCGQSAQLRHLEKMFKEVFKEVSVKVEKKELCLLKTRVWESFLEVLQEKSREGHPVPLVIPVGNQIQIIDIPSNISNTQLALKEFLENNKLEEVTVPNSRVPDCDERLAQRSSFMQNRSPCNTSQTIRQTVIKLSKAIIQRIISDGALLQALTKNIKSVDGKFQWLQPDCILVKCLVDNPAKDWEQNVAEVISCFVSTHLQDPGERPLQQHRKPPECRGPQPYPEDSQSAASSHPLSLAGIVEQTIPNLKPAQLKILRMSAAVEKLCKDYPGLEITLDEENKTAIVKNPEDFPKKAFNDVLAFVTCFREMKIHLTPLLIKMYEKEDAREWIQKTLIDKKKLVCHWEVCNDGIVFCGQSAQLGHLEKMFKEVFKEVSVKVEKKELCLLKTRVWESFLEVLQEKSREGHPAPLVIPVGNQIQIIDIPSNISNIQLALKEFLENNKLEEVTVQIKYNHFKFLQNYCKEETKAIYEMGSIRGVSFLFQRNGMTAEGPKKCLPDIFLEVKRLISKIKENKMTFTMPGVAKHLTGAHGQDCIAQIALTTRCFITTKNGGDGTSSAHQTGHILAEVLLSASCKLQIVQGDITECEVDGIVSPANIELDHAFGVAHAIVKAGGQSIQDELDELIAKEGSLSEGEVVVTGSGRLACLFVLHAVLPKWNGADKDEEKILTSTVQKTLEKAEEKKIASIAMPALSYGILRYPVQSATDTIMRTIGNYFLNEGNSSCLKTLILISVTAEPLQGFLKAAKNVFGKRLAIKDEPKTSTSQGYAQSGKPQSPIWIIPVETAKSSAFRTEQKWGADSQRSDKYGDRHLGNRHGTGHSGGRAVDDEMDNSSSKDERCQAVDVYIYSDKASAITEAREKICNHVRETCTSHTESNPLIANFTPKQMEEVFMLQNKYDVDVTLDKKDEVTISGVKLDVVKAVSNFKDIMLSATAQRYQAAGMPPVRWQFETSEDKFTEFEPDNVITIEAAYKKKENQVFFSDKRGRKYKIVFKEWKEYCLDQQKPPITVRRRDLLEERKNNDIPNHWAPMSKDKVIKVKLSPDSNEYKRVAVHFGQPARIKQIERIQNPTLYQQYEMKKKEIEMYNPKGMENEKCLFHGTSSDSVDSIIVNGFNRSYCGKNGTALGAGVYFAADSATSMGYAQGGQMFQARVLVGEYTQGNSGMRMAPNKPGSKRPYDSVANASSRATVFVIFHDSQAYPEYLISF